ncbi:hypothetical protein [Sporofaciens musculi]|uniref:hypothetical protein n=1 Tax=Sporofaciens musculi TaxID=2681861 RepID=UPI00259CE530|nr:hypothetical protein [Sporofaciens musculi]
MKTLRFEGYSDDTFGEYGLTGDDIDNCASMNPIQCVVDCGEYGRLMIIGQYSQASCANGCWMVGVSKVEEYDDFPNWDMRLREGVETKYSPALEIDLPPGDFNLTWYINGNKVDT